jgi:peptide/nickel transport system substrate-binding protein
VSHSPGSFWLRAISSIFVISFLALLYWSSLLQEDRLRSLENTLLQVKSEITSLRTENGKNGKNGHVEPRLRPYIDPSFPNILGEDPYFTRTLPKILGEDFTPKGTLKIATYGKEEDLHPFRQEYQIGIWHGYCVANAGMTKFGRYDSFCPNLALKIEERPSGREDEATFWVHLRDNTFWHPLDPAHFPPDIALAPHFLKKHPVTAFDFEFYMQAIKNPHVDLPGAVALREILRNLDKIEVIDDLTFVVHYKKILVKDTSGKTSYKLPYAAKVQVCALTPLPCYIFKYNADGKKIVTDDREPDFYAKSSVWAQQFAHHFAKSVIPSCGPWVFDGMSPTQIRFRRNPDYFLPTVALYDAIETYLVENPDAIWRDFMAQKIDGCNIFPQNLVELDGFLHSPFYEKEKAKGHTVSRIEYLDKVFAFVGWNLKNPLFASRKVRQALSMAIDTKRMIEQNLCGKGVQISGPFFCMSPSCDTSIAPYRYDPDEARRLLTEEGWNDSDGDGILDKVIEGKHTPFRFKLNYYVKNPVTKANVELVATLLKQIGIDCQLQGQDVADLFAAVEDKTFDAYYLAWAFGLPPEDPDQIWHSRGASEKGSSNTVGFANPEADRLIEQLKYEDNEETRRQLYYRFHRLIHEEAPYAFLYTPRATLVYWNWLHNIFIPKERQDLVPGADEAEPSLASGYKE